MFLFQDWDGAIQDKVTTLQAFVGRLSTANKCVFLGTM